MLIPGGGGGGGGGGGAKSWEMVVFCAGVWGRGRVGGLHIAEKSYVTLLRSRGRDQAFSFVKKERERERERGCAFMDLKVFKASRTSKSACPDGGRAVPVEAILIHVNYEQLRQIHVQRAVHCFL